MKRIVGIVIAVMLVMSIGACAKKNEHWGQKFDEKGKWWKQEGQSWDRKDNIFMAVGRSNPDWKDDYDKRRSADLDARAQVAAFMQSLVDNYMKEIRSRNYSISKSVIESSANESVLGSVIVNRKKKGKIYYSLVKVDLNYFFQKIYDNFKEPNQDALANLKKLETPVVEKSIITGGTNETAQ